MAQGLIACAPRGEPGEVYNLASGVETTIRELAELINELTGTRRRSRSRRPATGTTRASGSATRKTRRELGFEATVPLREGLETTIEWTRANREFIDACIAKHAERMREAGAEVSCRRMIVCPDCSHELATLETDRCEHCGRSFDRRTGYRRCSAPTTCSEPIVQAYRDHYEQIAADDLSNGIQHDDHMAIEADRLLAGRRGRPGSRCATSASARASCSTGSLDRAAALGHRRRPRRPVPAAAGRAATTSGSCRRTPSGCRSATEFDVIVSSDVLEHVLNVGDFLVSVRRGAPTGRPLRRARAAHATR